MSQTYEFYTARADEAAAEAEVAQLDNVRDRALRSEKTWRSLAVQAQRTLQRRERIEKERAEKREQDETAAF